MKPKIVWKQYGVASFLSFPINFDWYSKKKAQAADKVQVASQAWNFNVAATRIAVA